MLLYPYIIFTRGKIDSCADYAFTLCRSQVDCELAAATQDEVNGYDKHIISIGGTRAKHWGNADSVYIVDFPSCIPCLKQYTHCIGIYLVKRRGLCQSQGHHGPCELQHDLPRQPHGRKVCCHSSYQQTALPAQWQGTTSAPWRASTIGYRHQTRRQTQKRCGPKKT